MRGRNEENINQVTNKNVIIFLKRFPTEYILSNLGLQVDAPRLCCTLIKPYRLRDHVAVLGDCHGCLSFHIGGQEFHVKGEGFRSRDEGNSFSTVFPRFLRSIVFKAILKNFKRVASFNVARHRPGS